MLANDILNYVIRPLLQITNLWSPEAEILVFGTGMVETNYNYLMQSGAPTVGAIGFWQMEKATYLDHCKWLKHPDRRVLLNGILGSCYYEILPTDPSALAVNLRLAALLCRVHYLRVQERLPHGSAADFAAYHKKYYNTSKGKADADKNTAVFQRIIDGH